MIVSTTLAGPGAEDSIVDALRSCSALVDHHLVLLSGCQIRRVCGALEEQHPGKPVTFIEYPWPDSYGEARTYALRRAEEFGARWALTVDCDERLELDRKVLPTDADEFRGFDALTVGDRDLLYQKPRLLRCGAGLRWEWPCAERLIGADGKPPSTARIHGSFWELPKSEGAEIRRAERGVRHMPDVLAQGENAHARRHLAECHLTLGHDGEARLHFLAVATNDEAPLFERTWARYRLAEFHCLDGRYQEALCVAGHALAQDPGLIQELGWVMAYANAKLKDFTAAALWCSYVLNAPIDMARGGHRSRTWKPGATELLAKIEAAATAQGAPWEREHFAERREQFVGDYAVLAHALTETLCGPEVKESHFDLGAGNGLLVEPMRVRGWLSRGVEANVNAKAETPESVRPHIDFGVSLEYWEDWGGRADLVSCIEVGEHVPTESADLLVESCCALSKRWIYFSAAQPGQGGVGHVNEQPREWWKAKFLARGWTLDADATQALVDKLSGLTRCWWLARNAMLFKKS